MFGMGLSLGEMGLNKYGVFGPEGITSLFALMELYFEKNY
jgi:hypothetical protein